MNQKHWLSSYSADMPHDIDPDAYTSVTEIVEGAMTRYRDNIAFTSFDQHITFSEIDRLSACLAAYLQKNLGVKKGDRVALMTPNIVAFPVTTVALLRLGAIQVNVNPLYTPTELRHQLDDAGVGIIFVHEGSTLTLSEIIAETSVKHVITVQNDDCLKDSSAPPLNKNIQQALNFSELLVEGALLSRDPVTITGEDTVFLQYTGGTTGLSKGAILSHRNLVANIEQFKALIGPSLREGEDKVLTVLPLYHIFGLMANFLVYFSNGAQNILIADAKNMDALLATIKDIGLSAITGVNTLFIGLMAQPKFKDVDWSNMRLTLGGGSPVFRSTSDKWKSIIGHHIIEGYGLSETSPTLTGNLIENKNFTGTVGVPISSTDIILLDDNDNTVAIGEAGEICASGPQVMSGYWNREDANAEVFTKEGYFRTGDIGVFDEKGFLKIVDRKKNMILVSGFNVYPNEIETAVSNCSGVLECACIGVPNEKTGEAVKLFVVKDASKEGQEVLSKESLMDFCRDRLTGYKVPKIIEFLDELPKSTVGKILRRNLK